MVRFACYTAVLAGAADLAGCNTAGARLADLPDLRIAVAVAPDLDSDDDDTSRPSHIEIGLAYDMAAFQRDHGGDCATLEDDISGTVQNEVRLRVDSPGDYDAESDECTQPYLISPMFFLGDREAGHIEFHDSSLAITADFAPSGFSPRMARPVAPTPTWQLAAGQPFAFAWSHAEELLGNGPDDVSVRFGHDRHYYFNDDSFPITEITETEIRGTVPVMPVDSGVGGIQIVLLWRNGLNNNSEPATTCTGATACTVSSYQDYEHTAVLTP
jgi:hypothetical protein